MSVRVSVLVLCVVSMWPVTARAGGPGSPAVPAPVVRRPVAFEAPEGPTGTHLRFVASARGYSLLVKPSGLVIQRGSDAVTIKFEGASGNPRITPFGALPGGTNYLIGNEPSAWRRNVPSFNGIRYHDLYPGMDLVLHATDTELVYNVVTRPGRSARGVRMRITAAADARIAETASPLPATGSLVYASFFGGAWTESSAATQMIAVDGSGAAYVTGMTELTQQGPAVAFVTKIAPDGQSIVYSTYLGGAATRDSVNHTVGHAVAVDASGSAVVVGTTYSNGFPQTAGTVRHPYIQGFMFLTKLTPSGADIVYSAVWGGSSHDSSTGVALDGSGNAYVTGKTHTTSILVEGGAFPITPGAAQTTCTCYPSMTPATDAFVVKFNSTATGVLYGTYIGGSYADGAYAIAVNQAGEAHVTGYTTTDDFPVVNAIQPLMAGGRTDAFVTKVSADGSQFIFSTYLGGQENEVRERPGGIALDSAGNAYVSGYTESANFPTTAGAFQSDRPPSAWANAWQGYVTKFTPSGQLVYSTFVGGNSGSVATGIAVDAAGRAHVAGGTASSNFPVTGDAVQPLAGGLDDGFLTILSAGGDAVEYSTYLGGATQDLANGVAIGSNGGVYLAGQTWGAVGFPTTPGAFQPVGGGGADFFVARIQFSVPEPPAPDPIALVEALASASGGFRPGRQLLRNALANLRAAEVTAACNQLAAFTHQVRAQRGKSVADAVAGEWIASAGAIRLALGCR